MLVRFAFLSRRVKSSLGNKCRTPPDICAFRLESVIAFVSYAKATARQGEADPA